MNPLAIVLAVLSAAPEIVGDIEKLIAAFKSGGAQAAQALLGPEIDAETSQTVLRLLGKLP